MNKCRIALALRSILLATGSGSEEPPKKATKLPENRLSISTTKKVDELESPMTVLSVKLTLARVAIKESKVRYAIRYIETDEQALRLSYNVVGKLVHNALASIDPFDSPATAV